MFTYTLLTHKNGYVIFAENGEKYIEQEFDPAKPFVNGEPQAFDSLAEAEAHAADLILQLG